jgi:hypothetical protein
MGIALVVRLAGPIAAPLTNRYYIYLDSTLFTVDGTITNNAEVYTSVDGSSTMLESTPNIGISINNQTGATTPNIVNGLITWTESSGSGTHSYTTPVTLTITPPPGPNTFVLQGTIRFRNETSIDSFGTDTKMSYVYTSFGGSGNSGTTPLSHGQVSDAFDIGILLAATSLCVHEDSMVHVRRKVSGTSVDSLVAIKDLKTDPNIRLIGSNGEEIELLYNLKCLPVTEYTLYSKNIFGENCPSRDLYISGGHPILVDGKERLPRELINGSTIRTVCLPQAPVYTLCTESRTFALINNVPVCTWKREDLESTISAQIKDIFQKQ